MNGTHVIDKQCAKRYLSYISIPICVCQTMNGTRVIDKQGAKRYLSYLGTHMNNTVKYDNFRAHVYVKI